MSRLPTYFLIGLPSTRNPVPGPKAVKPNTWVLGKKTKIRRSYRSSPCPGSGSDFEQRSPCRRPVLVLEESCGRSLLCLPPAACWPAACCLRPSAFRSLPLPVSVTKLQLYVSLGHAIQQQKLQSSRRISVFKAKIPMCTIFRRSVFSQTAVALAVYHTTPRHGMSCHIVSHAVMS